MFDAVRDDLVVLATNLTGTVSTFENEDGFGRDGGVQVGTAGVYERDQRGGETCDFFLAEVTLGDVVAQTACTVNTNFALRH
ncbi:hypothetical protein D3C86_1973810 [compost metagenome]